VSVYLIRHGETPLNAARIFQFPDTPLSDRGQAQAKRVAARVADAGIVAVVHSDYARAEMTAQEVHATTGAPLSVDPLLRERSFGDLRGQKITDIGFDAYTDDYAPPNGESWAMFHERVAQAWDLIQKTAQQTDGHLAVVSHGLVCKALAERHLPVEQQPVHWPNTALTIFASEPPWTVELIACGTHLDGDDVADSGHMAGQ